MSENNLKHGYSHFVVAVTLLTFLGLINGLYNPFLYQASPQAFWLLDFAHYWVVPLTVIYILYKKYGVAPRDYGLAGSNKTYPAWEMVGAGIFVAIVLVITWNISWYIGLFFFGSDDLQFSFNLVIPDGALRVPVILYLAISAGFVEEVVFRGLTWSAVSVMEIGRLKKAFYLILSSLLFAVVHWEQGLASVVGSFGFGFVAAAFYLQLKNLWPMIAAHSLADIYFFW